MDVSWKHPETAGSLKDPDKKYRSRRNLLTTNNGMIIGKKKINMKDLKFFNIYPFKISEKTAKNGIIDHINFFQIKIIFKITQNLNTHFLKINNYQR